MQLSRTSQSFILASLTILLCVSSSLLTSKYTSMRDRSERVATETLCIEHTTQTEGCPAHQQAAEVPLPHLLGVLRRRVLVVHRGHGHAHLLAVLAVLGSLLRLGDGVVGSARTAILV